MAKQVRLSDSEYVELTRKRDHTFRRWRWFWGILFFLGLFSFFLVSSLTQSISGDFSDERQTFYLGFITGATIGFMWILIAHQTALCFKEWLDARQGYRTERLMLKYHDEVKNKGGNDA